MLFVPFCGPINLVISNFRSLSLITNKGGIALRDDKEIVGLLCQGAEEKHGRERIPKMCYADAVPGIEREHLQDGLSIAADAGHRRRYNVRIWSCGN